MWGTIVGMNGTKDLRDAKAMLTESEIQLMYGIGIVQLRRMRARSVGPCFIKVSGVIGKRGGRVLYARAELEAWLATLPVGGGPSLICGGDTE